MTDGQVVRSGGITYQVARTLPLGNYYGRVTILNDDNGDTFLGLASFDGWRMVKISEETAESLVRDLCQGDSDV